MAVGVVVERRKSDNRWVDETWKPVEVIPGAPPVEGWREIAAGEGWTRYHAATVPLELRRGEAESYKYNLSSSRPSIFVVLAPCEAEIPWRVRLVTAVPHEAEAYQTTVELTVEAVPMPPGIADWMRAFADAHFAPEPFRKRTRGKAPALEEAKFGKEPIFARRRTGSGAEEEGDG